VDTCILGSQDRATLVHKVCVFGTTNFVQNLGTLIGVASVQLHSCKLGVASVQLHSCKLGVAFVQLHSCKLGVAPVQLHSCKLWVVSVQLHSCKLWVASVQLHSCKLVVKPEMGLLFTLSVISPLLKQTEKF